MVKSQNTHRCSQCISCISLTDSVLPSFTLYVSSDVSLVFESDSNNRQILLTSGKVSCCVSWGIGDDDVPLAPPVSQHVSGIHR